MRDRLDVMMTLDKELSSIFNIPPLHLTREKGIMDEAPEDENEVIDKMSECES